MWNVRNNPVSVSWNQTFGSRKDKKEPTREIIIIKKERKNSNWFWADT